MPCLCDSLWLSPGTGISVLREQFGCRFVVAGSLEDHQGAMHLDYALHAFGPAMISIMNKSVWE